MLLCVFLVYHGLHFFQNQRKIVFTGQADHENNQEHQQWREQDVQHGCGNGKILKQEEVDGDFNGQSNKDLGNKKRNYAKKSQPSQAPFLLRKSILVCFFDFDIERAGVTEDFGGLC